METARRSLNIVLVVLASVVFVAITLDLPAGPLCHVKRQRGRFDLAWIHHRIIPRLQHH